MKLCFKKEQDGKQKKEILQLSRDMSTWSQYLDETPAPNPTPETCSDGEMSNSYAIAHPEIASSAALFSKT